MKKAHAEAQSRKETAKKFSLSPARQAAFEALTKIESERAFSSALLPKLEEDLSAKDRSLCHELTLGVLRKQIYLDKIIEKLTAKATEKLDLAVVLALRLGLYQLLFLDKIPQFAAINESVNLVQRAKKTSAKGLVNAVLRRATREKIELEFADSIEELSVRTSHPRWILERWVRQFGYEETANLAAANNETPRAAFRFTGKISRKGAKTQSEIPERPNAAESQVVAGCFFAERFDEDLHELSERGEIYFQDEASQMVASLLNIGENEKFLDVCASPGGKTTFVASRAETRQNLLVAGDLHWHRVKFLQENCRRQGAEFVQIVQYDAEKALPFAEDSFERVLVDAPCSGTGTLRHNPEIRYFLNENDLAALSEKQLAILQNASKLVKGGGNLIYSTCSLEIEENEAVVEAFLRRNPEFEKIPMRLPEKFLTERGFARTFPHRDDMDGFFIAAFQKKH